MMQTIAAFKRDVHSYAEPERMRIAHVHLELSVHFSEQVLQGSATLRIASPVEAGEELVLDTRDLGIDGVLVSKDGESYAETPFRLGRSDRLLGAPLTIAIPKGTSHVQVR